MFVFINSNRVFGTTELFEEKSKILLEILDVYVILLVSIFFPSFKYPIIINLLIRYSHLNYNFLKSSS